MRCGARFLRNKADSAVAEFEVGIPKPATSKRVSKTESARPASLLRSFDDLVIQVAGFMIAAELAQRRLVELKQDFAQLLGLGIAGGEARSVDLAQRAHERIAVLVADFAVVVAMTIVQTWLAHAALHGGASDSILPPDGDSNQGAAMSGQLLLLRLAHRVVSLLCNKISAIGAWRTLVSRQIA